MLLQKSVIKVVFHPSLFERFVLGIKNPMKLYGTTYWMKRRLIKRGFPRVTVNIFIHDLREQATIVADRQGLCYYDDEHKRNAIGITFPQLYSVNGVIDQFHDELEQRMKALGW